MTISTSPSVLLRSLMDQAEVPALQFLLTPPTSLAVPGCSVTAGLMSEEEFFCTPLNQYLELDDDTHALIKEAALNLVQSMDLPSDDVGYIKGRIDADDADGVTTQIRIKHRSEF